MSESSTSTEPIEQLPPPSNQQWVTELPLKSQIDAIDFKLDRVADQLSAIADFLSEILSRQVATQGETKAIKASIDKVANIDASEVMGMLGGLLK